MPQNILMKLFARSQQCDPIQPVFHQAVQFEQVFKNALTTRWRTRCWRRGLCERPARVPAAKTRYYGGFFVSVWHHTGFFRLLQSPGMRIKARGSVSHWPRLGQWARMLAAMVAVSAVASASSSAGAPVL